MNFLLDSDGQEGQSWSKLSVTSRQSPTPINSPTKPVKGQLIKQTCLLFNVLGLESPLVLKTEVSRLAERAREESERNGVVVLSLCMANLFANKKSLSVEITEPVQTLVNCRLTISLKSPLMSEKLLRELNPMTITVLSANNLPDVPVGYDELQEKCVSCVSVSFNCFIALDVSQLMLVTNLLVTMKPSRLLGSRRLQVWPGSRAECSY